MRGPNGLEQADNPGADVAVADQADGHVAEFLADRVGPVEVAAPLAAGQRHMALRDEARLGQDGADRELGDGAGVAARGVDHRDPALAGRPHVDVDRAAARDADQPQPGCPVEQPSVHRGDVGDQDLGVGDEVGDVRGLADELAQACQRAAGLAVAHRLVGPGEFAGADVELAAGGRAQGVRRRPPAS
jgi:hypothetical protein